MLSAVLVVPSEQLVAANAVGQAMGWGETSYTLPLCSLDGEAEEPTHWACRVDVAPSFIELLTAASEGSLPPGLPPAASSMLAVLAADFSEELWGAAHLDKVLTTLQLRRFQ